MAISMNLLVAVVRDTNACGSESLLSAEDFIDIDTRRTMLPAQADFRNRRKSCKNSAVLHFFAIREAVHVGRSHRFIIDYQEWRLSSNGCGFVGIGEPGPQCFVVNREIKLDARAVCVDDQGKSSQSPWIR